MALPEAIQLEIVAPDRLVFSGEVQEVTIPGAEGYLGILPGHAPLLSELKTGIISYPEDGDRVQLFCSSGFAEVLPDRVIVLAEEVESPEMIDGAQARADRERGRATAPVPGTRNRLRRRPHPVGAGLRTAATGGLTPRPRSSPTLPKVLQERARFAIMRSVRHSGWGMV